MKIRELRPSAGDSDYAELQMYVAGQNFVEGHSLTLYTSAGAVDQTYTFPTPANVTHGENQRTILIGDSAVGVTPDLEKPELNIPAAGGAACWNAGGLPADCVAWGNFAGGAAFEAATGTSAGSPVSPGGVTAGMAIRRKITPNCPTLLEDADDTNVSATDFEEVTPAPRNNASPITEMGCAPPTAPDTSITAPKPPSPTKNTEATFTFTANPSAEATFECKLDLGAFSACTSPKTYTGLSSTGQTGTTHTFEVRAVHPVNGTDPSPAKYQWVVDTTAPTASITTHPTNPSPGANPAFKYTSNESPSTFKCRLSPIEASFSSCPASGKTYNQTLADGEYTFEVIAIDQALNAQSELSPTTYPWTVNNVVPDTTPPETFIDTKPPDPSESPTAAFTYHSNEGGSTFKCALDGELVPCQASGIAYANLANGSHTFRAQATDPSNNPDPTPAGYTFTVVLPDIGPPPITPPPDTRLSSKPPAKTHDRTPTVKFKATITPATFECKLDGRGYKPCRSPFTTKGLSFGKHSIKVRATAGGLTDPTPAQASFKVVKG
jgi:hypothetical protein